MKYSLLLYGLLFFCSSIKGQQNNFESWSPNASLSSNLIHEVNDEPATYIEDWQEDISKRTLNAAFFMNSKGDIRSEFSSKPIHYYKNGTLERIDPKLMKSQSGFAASQQPYPTYLNEDGSFSLSIGKYDLLTMRKGHLQNQPNVNSSFEFQKNTAYFENYFDGIDKQVVFSENKIKYAYRLNESIPINQDNLVISETFELPTNFECVPLKNHSYVKDGLIYGTLVVQNENGVEVAKIRPLLCYDANNKHILGGYRIVKKDGENRLESCVPFSWLSDVQRAYPVIIDPEISGPPVEWNGGDMPSCLLPAFNSDSVLVNIPAGVTISGFFVTGSFYANPFSPAVMSDGVMNFSTNCANSQNFTIVGPTADLPGTAYLDSFDLRNPLACCFPESCNDTSVWVSMNLARGDYGIGCNTQYVLYDDITDWPFRVVVYGKTPEVYGNEFYVSQASICSNTCTFNATGYARYGVAPYTFTHPWTNEVVTAGENVGCGAGSTNNVFTLTIPDCPIYCDENYTSLDIPPPVITDACGQSILNIPNNSKPIDPTPNVITDYDDIFCSGETVEIELISCLEGGVVQHFGEGMNGFGPISFTAENNSEMALTQSYFTFASLGDCYSDTTEIVIDIVPNPQAQIELNANPSIVNVNLQASDVSSVYNSPIQSWDWTLDGSNSSSDSIFIEAFPTPGNYEICLNIVDSEGCFDDICETLLVVPADIENINVITPNDDGINDQLAFQYLEFYPENEIFIFNRWGNLVYQAESYDNTWAGNELTEGTYFYILEIRGINKTYSSFFQLKR